VQHEAVSTQVISDSRRNEFNETLVSSTQRHCIALLEDGAVDRGVIVRFPAVPGFAAENSSASRR